MPQAHIGPESDPSRYRRPADTSRPGILGALGNLARKGRDALRTPADRTQRESARFLPGLPSSRTTIDVVTFVAPDKDGRAALWQQDKAGNVTVTYDIVRIMQHTHEGAEQLPELVSSAAWRLAMDERAAAQVVSEAAILAVRPQPDPAPLQIHPE